MRLLNSFVTRKAMSQLVRTQTPVAMPLTCRGKISDMRSQGMGPQPTAKPAGEKQASEPTEPRPFALYRPPGLKLCRAAG